MADIELKPWTEFPFHTRIYLRFSDLDAFGHVNNAVFATYFEIARTQYWKEVIDWNRDETGIIVARLEIDYRVPILLDDEIACYLRTSRVGNSSFDIEYRLVKDPERNAVLCASGKTVQVCFDYQKKRSVPLPEKYRNRMMGK
ncbi:MAG: acyl-CoA thioesterase [Mucilaginibacter polytrichastri]|nr:acyl-CoA thioesterase [Mucilaginibacter polytrichastri]